MEKPIGKPVETTKSQLKETNDESSLYSKLEIFPEPSCKEMPEIYPRAPNNSPNITKSFVSKPASQTGPWHQPAVKSRNPEEQTFTFDQVASSGRDAPIWKGTIPQQGSSMQPFCLNTNLNQQGFPVSYSNRHNPAIPSFKPVCRVPCQNDCVEKMDCRSKNCGRPASCNDRYPFGPSTTPSKGSFERYSSSSSARNKFQFCSNNNPNGNVPESTYNTMNETTPGNIFHCPHCGISSRLPERSDASTASQTTIFDARYKYDPYLPRGDKRNSPFKPQCRGAVKKAVSVRCVKCGNENEETGTYNYRKYF